MAATHTIRLITDKAGEIRREDGTMAMLAAGVGFLLSFFYKRETFHIALNRCFTEYKSEAARPAISEDRLNFKMVTSNWQADRLEAEGFSFRRHPTYFNHNLEEYTHWLDCGAWAACTFVGKEFAAINWVITSRQTQKALKEIPLKVHYDNHEAFTRGAWVNPRFRGMELYNFTTRRRDGYLMEKGFTTKRGVVDFTNRNGRGISTAAGSKIVGTGWRTRILGLTFWREQYFANPVDWSDADSLKSKRRRK